MDNTEEITMDEEFSISELRHPQKLIKETKVNSEKPRAKTLEQKTIELDKKQKSLVEIYKSEPRVPVRIAPSYAKYFGRVMRVAINGIIVAVKCNGETVSIPESYAAEVFRRMSEMDKYELRLNKMARVENNFETSPGQLNFFG